MKKRKSGRKAVKLAVLGASIAGAAATAYFFLGPKGKKHQREAKAWAIKMKGDVVRSVLDVFSDASKRMETAKELTGEERRKKLEEITKLVDTHGQNMATKPSILSPKP